MAELLARSPKGILYKRDEFSGFVGSLEKYGGKSGSNSDRAFYLKAYDGGSYTRDRIVGGEIFVENLSISMLGGIQPDKLAELKGLTSDGLLQRFIRVMMRAPGLAQDVPGTAQEYFDELIRTLVKLQPMVLWFSDQALAVVATLRARLHELEQASEGMAVGFPAFVGKLAGVAGRLAVILHVVKHVETDIPYRIDTDVAEAVQTLVLGCLGGGAQRGFALMLIGGCLIECGVLDPGDEPFDYLFPDSPGTLRFQQRTEPAPSRPTVRVAGVLAAHAGRLVIAHG